MDNFFTLCLLGIFVLVGLALLPRLLGGFGGRGMGPGMSGTDFSQRGDDRPSFDDPDVRTRGGFGGGGFGGGGLFGGGQRRGGGTFGGLKRGGGGGARRYDSSNAKTRGGFGRGR